MVCMALKAIIFKASRTSLPTDVNADNGVPHADLKGKRL